MYTQELLDNLLNCPKKIISGWREIKDSRHGLKKVIELESEDGSHKFRVFYTQNRYLPESFSIGIAYLSKTEMGKLLLLRCNGIHGGSDAHGHHTYTHSHRPSVDELNKGNKEPVIIEPKNEYSTLETAIPFFGKFVKVVDSDRIKYFPTPQGVKQSDLFDQ